MYLLDSVFGKGLWLIPVLSFIGAAWSFYKAYTQWKSGSVWTEYPKFGEPIVHQSDKKVNPLSIFSTWTGIVCLAIFIASMMTK